MATILNQNIKDDDALVLGVSEGGSDPLLTLNEEEGADFLAFLDGLDREPPAPALVDGFRRRRLNQARSRVAG